jgi:hypothetical protein
MLKKIQKQKVVLNVAISLGYFILTKKSQQDPLLPFDGMA